jgi:hypothetical protein
VWSCAVILVLGNRKELPEDCLLARVPLEIILHVIGFVKDFEFEVKKEIEDPITVDHIREISKIHLL